MPSTEDKLQLTVEREDGERLQISISPDATPYELKLRVYEHWKVIADHQQLHKGDEELLGSFTSLLGFDLKSGDVLQMRSNDNEELPEIEDFRSVEELRVAIQKAVNDRKNLEDYDALIRFLCEKTNERIGRLLVDICQPNTEFKEMPKKLLHLISRLGPRGSVVHLKARASDSIRVVKMRLFARLAIETNSIQLFDAGAELADDFALSGLSSPAPYLEIRQKRPSVIRAAREDDTMASCYEELLNSTTSALTMKCDLEVEVLRRLDELRPRWKLLRVLEAEMAALEATKPSDFRVVATNWDNFAERTTVGANGREPLFILKFRLAQALKLRDRELLLYSRRLLPDDTKSLIELGIKDGDNLGYRAHTANPLQPDVQLLSYFFKSMDVFKVWELCKMAADVERLSRRIVCLKATRDDPPAAQRVAAEVVHAFRKPEVPAASTPPSDSSASLDQLQAELRLARIREAELESNNLCIVCMERPRETLFLPCEHLVVCSDPACRNLSTCPLDRRPIEQKVRARLS
ncbi:Leucine-rich repeat (LRR) protein [Aphelenchoides fujianensis]|nr:Leucine-rich repeat (LRR) protein [Aphelenchoides fujianensis]